MVNRRDSDVEWLKMATFAVVVQRLKDFTLALNVSWDSCVLSLMLSPFHFLNSSFTQKGIRISLSLFPSFCLCFVKLLTRCLLFFCIFLISVHWGFKKETKQPNPAMASSSSKIVLLTKHLPSLWCLLFVCLFVTQRFAKIDSLSTFLNFNLSFSISFELKSQERKKTKQV